MSEKSTTVGLIEYIDEQLRANEPHNRYVFVHGDKLKDCRDELAKQAEEIERLRNRQRSDEQQLVAIANFFGKDARQVVGDDKSIAGLVKEEFKQQAERVAALEGLPEKWRDSVANDNDIGRKYAMRFCADELAAVLRDSTAKHESGGE